MKNLISISASPAHKALRNLDTTLQDYMAFTRKTPATVIKLKGGQLLLGNQRSQFGATFDGLFERVRKQMPQEGSITRTIEPLLQRGRQPVRVRDRATRQAANLLGSNPSGVFAVNRTSAGRLFIKQARFSKRGKRLLARRGSEGEARRGAVIDRRAGDAILNRWSLSVALELIYRESGRGYLSLAFLAKRYRREVMTRKRSLVANESHRLEGRNASGQLIQRIRFKGTPGAASFRLEGFAGGLADAIVQKEVATVLNLLAADTLDYLYRRVQRPEWNRQTNQLYRADHR